MKFYNVGDKVWYAHYDMTELKKSCPVCFGKKEVTLILGNGDKVRVPCDFCGKGFNEPTGFVTEYEFVARAQPIIITEVQSKVDTIGEERRYYFGNRIVDIQDLFDIEEEALLRCNEKIKQREFEETTQAYAIKAHHLKSYAWNAGYHLRQAQQHRKQADYHDRKATLCKERAK